MSRLSIWEGDEQDSNLLRSHVVKQDRLFAKAMRRAHPELAPPKPKYVRKRDRVIPEVLPDDAADLAPRVAQIMSIERVAAAIVASIEGTVVTPLQILGRSHNKHIVKARHGVFHVLFYKHGMSFAAIGRLFLRDPQTVRHGIVQFEKRHNRVARIASLKSLVRSVV